uniref:F-box domain-containing protein n=1 Tax=Panagrellus redivivus TaxID=6233 RepID=A0A7E4W3W3_PANRE
MSAEEGSSSASGSAETPSNPAGVSDDNTNNADQPTTAPPDSQPQPESVMAEPTPPSNNAINNLLAALNENRSEMRHRNRQIQELITRVEQLQKDLQEKDETIEDLNKQVSIRNKHNGPKLPDGLQFPTEIFDEIFLYCNAKTRLNFAAANSYFLKRYGVWRDVKSLYVTRSPVENQDRVTVIPHTYTIRTNCTNLGTFKATNIFSLAKVMPLTKSLLIESNQYSISSQCNRIPPQHGFFPHLPELELLKICNITDNLSIKYTLSELFALPKLRVLHVREFRQDFLLPEPSTVAAPLWQMRLGLAFQNAEKLPELLDKLSPTLTSVDISPLRSFMPIASNVETQLLPAMAGHLENLTELHVPSVVSRHHSFEASLMLLRTFSKLRKVTFEALHLSAIVNIVNALPESCTHLTITDTFYINSEMVTLSSNQVLAIDKVLSEPKYSTVKTELSRITRPMTIQLGRLRGNSPPTVIKNVTSVVKIISNASVLPKCKMTEYDKRVFLWDGCILSRNEFLARIGVVPFDSSSSR